MVTSSGASGRIAVDAMGGDLGPAEVVAGVKLALNLTSLNPITLVGNEEILGPLLAQAGISSRGYRPGPYSNREDLLYAFDRFVLDKLREPQA